MNLINLMIDELQLLVVLPRMTILFLLIKKSANEHFFPGAPSSEGNFFSKLRFFGKKNEQEENG